jgi:O-antigen ligase
MNSAALKGVERDVSGWLLPAMVVLLPLMKPAVAYPVIAFDIIFLALAAALALGAARGRLVVGPRGNLFILAAYLLALTPSLLSSNHLSQSAFKLATTAYLAALAAATALSIRDETVLKRTVLAWLAATAALALLAVLSLGAFMIAPDGAVYAYSQSHLGTLPPGQYPRLSLTFFNANMACNYLTVSLGLLIIAYQRSWLSRSVTLLLLAGILLAALTTISPGLGGIAAAVGMGAFLLRRSRFMLVAGLIAAAAALLVSSFTPAPATSSYLFTLPGTDLHLAPSARLMIWTSAVFEIMKRPLIGHGLGVDAVSIFYYLPNGGLTHITDAHNIFLNVTAQAGLVGLTGVVVLIAYAVRLGRANRTALVLALTFANAFAYQGLTGSFEDTRHLWVLLGLLMAAARISLSRRGENSRRAGAPSPC